MRANTHSFALAKYNSCITCKEGSLIPQHKLTRQRLDAFRRHLQAEERSAATIEKYLRDTQAFFRWLQARPVDKRIVLAYKVELVGRYAPASVNSMLAALNAFFAFAGWPDCHIKALKIQKQTFSAADRELTRAEYLRLCRAAETRCSQRLSLVMQTLCASAHVAPQKVLPHNLRHLFARTFYSLEKDLGRLADILGHASVNTTRVYTMETGAEHRRLVERLQLVT